MSRLLAIIALALGLARVAVAGPELLRPLDASAPPPPLLAPGEGPRMDDPGLWIAARRREPDVGQLYHRYLRDRGPEARAEGLAALRSEGDMAALLAMVTSLRAGDDFKTQVLDHVATRGDAGQGILAWAAVHHDDPEVRTLALARLSGPAGPAVRSVVDVDLRGPDHVAASRAAVVAGSLALVDAIPLLIFGLTAEVPADQQGDLAWIAVSKQTVYVQSLEPVVGSGAGAYQPVLATLNEGFVFRVQDAVVVIYRAAVQRTLVAMTTWDTGRSTAELGYDRDAWLAWYNGDYVPWKNEQRIIADLAKEPEELK